MSCTFCPYAWYEYPNGVVRHVQVSKSMCEVCEYKFGRVVRDD